MAYSLTVNGVDRSGDINPTTVRVEDKLNSEMNTAFFEMTCILANKPLACQEVILYDDAAKEFAGVVIKAPERELLDELNLHYGVECYDHQHSFDRGWLPRAMRTCTPVILLLTLSVPIAQALL